MTPLALLTACGMPASIVPAPSSLQTPALSEHLRGASWMGRGLKARDLLYISNRNGTVNVYRYWQRTLVGVLTNFEQPMGMCADNLGNVYITDYQREKLYEYAHGGKKPIRAIADSPYNPYGCSVNQKNGDLAVANSIYGPYTPGNISIYPHGSGTPTIYEGPDEDHFISCAYDDRGDLLVESKVDYYYSYLYYYAFYYLPKNGGNLIPEDLQDPYTSSRFPYAEGLAWDGTYWVVEAYYDLFEFNINVKPKLVGKVVLSGGDGYPGPISLYRKNAHAEATQAVGGSGSDSKASADFWRYPAGGSPLHAITQDLDAPFGTAISLGT